jgi:PAS domain S-box-containing protein
VNDREAPDADRSPLGITLAYVAAGALWVILTSTVAHRMIGSATAIERFEGLMGWGFVLVTGLVLYLLLRRRTAALRRSELARREREAFLKHVTSAGPVVIFRMEVRDGSPAVTWVSDSVERLFGYSATETLTPGWWLANVHPDDRAEAVRRSAAVDTSVPLEYRLRTKQGDYRWIRDVLRVIGGDTTPEVLGVWLDVTEQHRAQQALEEREAFYRGLIENAADSILVLTGDGAVLYASPSFGRNTGYTAEDFAGRSAFALIHADDLPRVQAAFGRAARNPDEVITVEYRVRHSDGSWHPASSVGQRLPGTPLRMVINTRDITETRAVEEQLRRSQKFEAFGQLTAGIVHDFNNVLSVVLSNAELLLTEMPPELAEQRADVEHVKRAARGGADMVRKLLGFSRQADLRIVPLDLRPVVDDVEAMLRRIVPPNIRVRATVREPLPPARADAGAVQQILLNLATNARDAMPDGGELTIDVARAELDHRYLATHPWVVPGEYVTLAVTDTGAGMDEDTRARIFEPFFTTKPPGKGTGLGMPMISGLMKQHAGYVDVATELGRGTTVSIYFPAAPAGSTAHGPVASAPPRGGTETIVLTEDEEALRRTGKRILEKFGYTVLTAEDGSRCLEILEQRASQVDLVVSDVRMPGLSGVQLYHEVRRRGWTVPFLFASGEAARAFQEEHHLADVGFVQKPWTLDEVARAVRAALDRRQ